MFGQGSMTGIAISVFVKNSDAKEQGRILFHDIGDYLAASGSSKSSRASAAFAALQKRGDGPGSRPTNMVTGWISAMRLSTRIP